MLNTLARFLHLRSLARAARAPAHQLVVFGADRPRLVDQPVAPALTHVP